MCVGTHFLIFYSKEEVVVGLYLCSMSKSGYEKTTTTSCQTIIFLTLFTPANVADILHTGQLECFLAIHPVI